MDDHYEPYYQDDPETPGSKIINILAEWDEDHTGKAAIIAKIAETEFQFAHDDGEAAVEDDEDFIVFVEKAIRLVDDAVERADQ